MPKSPYGVDRDSGARLITVDATSMYRACPEEAVPLTKLVAEAFRPLALSAWLVPDRVERAAVQ